MRSRAVTFGFAALALFGAAGLGSGTATATPLIPLPEPPGQELLIKSRQRADYGPLSQEFLSQANLAYCGVASAVMVLNSLGVPAPAADGYGTHRFWTQSNFFASAASRRVVPPQTVAREGMTLAQLEGLLASHGLTTRRLHGDGIDLDDFRRLLRASLGHPHDRMLVNYDRKALGQSGGGHISPLAAYHEESDRALILDVARYRYPAVWVPVRDLWQAIRTLDRSSGRARGVVLVSRPATAAPAD
jgi:hypothetical protein